MPTMSKKPLATSMTNADKFAAYADRCRAAGFWVRHVRTRSGYAGTAVVVRGSRFAQAMELCRPIGITLSWDRWWLWVAIHPV